MKPVKEVINLETGVSFAPNKNLINYALSDRTTYKLVFEDAPEGSEDIPLTEDELKAMSMKELQLLAEEKNIACDRRRKEALIDGILGRG